MGDVSVKPTPEPKPTLVDRSSATVSPFVRRLLTGRPDRPIRRSALFLIVAIALGTNYNVVSVVVGLVALMLLALTDHVVVEL